MKLTHVAGAVAVAGLVSAAIGSPAMASSVKSVDQVLPALSTQYDAGDVVPEVVNLELFGILPEDVRAVGSDDVADYWVASQGNDSVCLIVHIRGGNEVSSASCTTVADFNISGLSLVIGENRANPERSSEAYYLPADVESSEVVGVEALGRNAAKTSQLIAGRPGALGLEPSTVSRSDGTEFTFNPLETGQ